MRFATDDRVTVTDPSHWNYNRPGVVVELCYDAMGRRGYLVEFPTGVSLFTVDQLDFTEEAPKA